MNEMERRGKAIEQLFILVEEWKQIANDAQCKNVELITALKLIASCNSYVEGDAVSIARNTIAKVTK